MIRSITIFIVTLLFVGYHCAIAQPASKPSGIKRDPALQVQKEMFWMGVDFKGAIYDDTTRFPEGFDPKKNPTRNG